MTVEETVLGSHRRARLPRLPFAIGLELGQLGFGFSLAGMIVLNLLFEAVDPLI